MLSVYHLAGWLTDEMEGEKERTVTEAAWQNIRAIVSRRFRNGNREPKKGLNGAPKVIADYPEIF